jgi:hypothetical protein
MSPTTSLAQNYSVSIAAKYYIDFNYSAALGRPESVISNGDITALLLTTFTYSCSFPERYEPAKGKTNLQILASEENYEAALILLDQR